MKITSDLGNKIINQVEKYTSFDINLMDLNGEIVASTDSSRILQTHLGALKVIETMENLILYAKDTKKFSGTKPGINFPILHQEQIVGVVGVSGDPEEIQEVSGLIRAFVEVILNQIHTQAQAHYLERQWSLWLQKLLHPHGFNQAELHEEALYTLKVDSNRQWFVILIEGESIQDSISVLKQEVAEQSLDFLCFLPFGKDELIMVVSGTFTRRQMLAERLLQLTHHECRIVVSDDGIGLNGIRNGYYQSKQVLRFDRKSKVIFSASWRLKRLITTLDEKSYQDICGKYESLLLEMSPIYIETIKKYIACNLSIKMTAEVLHIHRNTLTYRFKQIKTKTGLDMQKFEDIFILKIILEYLT